MMCPLVFQTRSALTVSIGNTSLAMVPREQHQAAAVPQRRLRPGPKHARRLDGGVCDPFQLIVFLQTLTIVGCLDETSTTTTSTSSTESSTSTSEAPTTSCVKYGWFGGCLETTTLSPTTAPKTGTPARGPTITTTRPLVKSHPITSPIASQTSL